MVPRIISGSENKIFKDDEVFFQKAERVIARQRIQTEVSTRFGWSNFFSACIVFLPPMNIYLYKRQPSHTASREFQEGPFYNGNQRVKNV